MFTNLKEAVASYNAVEEPLQPDAYTANLFETCLDAPIMVTRLIKESELDAIMESFINHKSEDLLESDTSESDDDVFSLLQTETFTF